MNQIIKDPDLNARLKKCVARRHEENTMTEEVRALFASKTDPRILEFMKSMLDQASGLACLADLAGMTIEDVVKKWVELMERHHPDLLENAGQDAAASRGSTREIDG